MKRGGMDSRFSFVQIRRPQSRQRKALGRAISPVSLPPRRSSPGRVGMGRPETSSDQNTGLRLLRKPSSISFLQ